MATVIDCPQFPVRTQPPDDDHNLRPLQTAFIVLEVTLVISGLGFVLLRAASGQGIPFHEAFGKGVELVFSLTTLVLFFGSPWFFRSLRWVAWLGWLLAATALVYALLTPEL